MFIKLNFGIWIFWAFRQRNPTDF